MIIPNVPVAIIEGNLATFLSLYVKGVRQSITGKDFNNFTDETILFSLLEYSKFDRAVQSMSESRIEYIVRKCVEFQKDSNYLNPDNNYKLVESDFDDSYEFTWLGLR